MKTIPFETWKDVLAYAQTGAPLYYKAPMERTPARLTAGGKSPFTYQAQARTIKIWPAGSVGRGRNRTADPFTADSGHLDRFSRPVEDGLAVEAHRDPVDEQAATELVMYIENTSDLSPDGPSGQGRSVLLNALRKWRKGTYDSTLGVRLFEYLTESGAKRYAKEYDSEKNWNTMFTPATRHEAAKQLEASFRSSVENGEYDHIDTRTGAGPRGHHSTEVEEHVDARGKTRLDKLRADLPPGYAVYTYSPGDGVTRYRFFKNASPKQDYFGPANGIYTALGYAEAEAFAQGLMSEAGVGEVRERVARAPRLDSFTRQYMETALWSSTDESNDQGGDPLDRNYSINDIAPETRDKMIADCANFQERFNELYDNSGQAGHDFWLSRNGHGTGFFDRDTPNADKLQNAAKSYGEFNLYVGDDGMIYGS